jgi:hypothetical protein
MPGLWAVGGDLLISFDHHYSTGYVLALMGWAVVALFAAFGGRRTWPIVLGAAVLAALAIWVHLSDNRDWLADLPVLGALLVVSIIAVVRLVVLGVRRVWRRLRARA